jgi:uncharacterized protein
MKSFLVLLGDKENHLLNQDLLIEHIDYMKNLHDQGKLVTCGSLLDNQGAVMVIKAASRDQAEELIRNDPFIKQDYYQKYVLKEYVEANDDNNWLIDG